MMEDMKSEEHRPRTFPNVLGHPGAHVTAGRSPAHQRSLPSSKTYSEVKVQQALAQAEHTLTNIRNLRRTLEPFNSAVLGAAINSAEHEIQNIVYRLRGH